MFRALVGMIIVTESASMHYTEHVLPPPPSSSTLLLPLPSSTDSFPKLANQSETILLETINPHLTHF